MPGDHIDGLDRKVEALLESGDLSDFAPRARALWEENPRPRAVLEAAVHVLAPRLHRRAYPRFAPHGMMALTGALQAMRYVDRPCARLLATQALWYASTEDKLPFYDWVPGSAAETVRQAQIHCFLACEEADFDRFERSSGPLFDQRGAPLCSDWSSPLEVAGRDLTNLGHKFIYLVKTMQLCEMVGERRSPARLFFPACHYLVLAPRDLSAAEHKDRIVGHRRGLSPPPQLSSRLPSGEALVPLLTAGDEEGVGVLVWEWLGAGVPPSAIVEMLQLFSARLVLVSSDEDWLAPIHAFNYTECVHWVLPYLSYSQQVTLVVMNALHLLRMIERTGGVSYEQLAHRWRPAYLSSLAPDRDGAFVAAGEAGDGPTAQRLALHASASRLSWPDHFAACARAAGRNDGPIHFGHDVKYVAATLSAFQRMRHPRRATLLLALAKFLAGCTRRQTLMDAMDFKDD